MKKYLGALVVAVSVFAVFGFQTRQAPDKKTEDRV